jgi:hypothetical protein
LIYENFYTEFQFNLLQVIGYSFNSDKKDLEDLMIVFKALVTDHGNLLKRVGFEPLLSEMIIRTVDQDPDYFKTLRGPIKVLN